MRRKELLDTVALFAAILIRLGGELPLVNVLMATTALRLGNPKHRVLALVNMALLAFHFGMAALERISGRGMLFKSKR